MAILYANTRDASEKVTASQAILNGLAKHGGLYVPTEIPKLDIPVEELAKMSYQIAYAVLKQIPDRLYRGRAESTVSIVRMIPNLTHEEIAPLVDADGAYYLELFHGATIAFKDMALSILPHYADDSCPQRMNRVKSDIVILTATSGDTGKAALAGLCRRCWYQDYCILPEEWCQPDPGEADGDPERVTNTHRCWYSW